MHTRERTKEHFMSKKMGQIDFKEVWTIPNIITYFRILCVPVFIALMAVGGMRADIVLFYAALGVFVVAAVSDLFDGWIARRFNMQSGIGMAIDPFADKLMHISVLFCLALCTGLTPFGEKYADVIGNKWFVHFAFVILIIVKELLMILIAPIVMKKGAKVKANWLGKVASCTVSIGVVLCFFHQYIYFADWGILAWGIAQSYAAGIWYAVDIVKQVKRINRGEQEAATAQMVKDEDAKIVEEKKEGKFEG